MKNNSYAIGLVLGYIEEHLQNETLDLDTIAKAAGYSKYHLHRMFSAMVGYTIHNYIQRRRLTEAARLLVFTDRPILEIALSAGYDTQRSFTRAFQGMYHASPRYYRKQKVFMPLQLKFDISSREELRGDRILEIKVVESDAIFLVGYTGNTKRGFHIIGKCWRLLHKNKHKIDNRADENFLFGVNDYSQYEEQSKNPAFTYIAAAEVTDVATIPKGMQAFSLAPTKYVVFSFRGQNQDSLQPIVEYIYQEWFPNATCRFNENNPYDFAKYGEVVDGNGQSDIQFWVPICSA